MADFPETIGNSVIRVKNPSGDVVSEVSGNPIAASLITKDIDFDQRQMLKYVDVVVAEVTDAARLALVNVEIGYRDSLSDAVQWLLPKSLEELDRALFCRITARYIKLRIQSDSVGVFWRLAALEVYGTSHGRRF